MAIPHDLITENKRLRNENERLKNDLEKRVKLIEDQLFSMNVDPDEVINVKEASEILGVGIKAIYNRVYTGKLEALKSGGTVCFLRSKVIGSMKRVNK